MGLISAQYNFGINELVYLWPEEDFSTNSVVTVQYGQEAVFIRNGVAIDESLIEGRWPVSTAILGELKKEEELIYGKGTFHAKLYYVNKDRDLSMVWGTQTPFTIKDSATGMAYKARARGGYSLGIDDSKLLILKTIGQMGRDKNYNVFTKFQLQNFISDKMQEIIISTVSSVIREMQIELYSVEGYYKTISEKVREEICKENLFESYGFKLKNFSITAIQISDEDYEKLQHYTNEAKQRQQDIALDRMYGKTYETETQREVLTRAASNEATGQGMNLGLGLAYAQQVGQAIGGMMGNVGQQKMVSNQPIPGKICPQCGAPVPQGSAFCPSCGTRIEQQAQTICPQCGKQIPAGAKFCPGCGTPAPTSVQPQAAFCPNCGAKNEGGSAFCSKCGHKLG